MNERFYAASVTGYSAHNRKPSQIWYVFDSVPPRLSRFVGFGEPARAEAEKLARKLNEEYS